MLPLLQSTSKVPDPPSTDTEAVPSQAPGQPALVDVTINSKEVPCSMVTELDPEHPLASVTVTS